MKKYKKVSQFSHTPEHKLILNNKVFDFKVDDIQSNKNIIMYPCPNSNNMIHLNEQFFNKISEYIKENDWLKFIEELKTDFKDNQSKYKKSLKSSIDNLSLIEKINKEGNIVREIIQFIDIIDFILIMAIFLSKEEDRFLLFEDRYDVNIAYGCGVPSDWKETLYYLIKVDLELFKETNKVIIEKITN